MTPNEVTQRALQLLAFHANPDTASDAVTADDERRARAVLAARPHVRNTVTGKLEPYALKWLKKTSFAAALNKFRAATGSRLGPRGRGRPRGRPRLSAAAALTAPRRPVARGQHIQGSRSVSVREAPGRGEDVHVKN